MRSSQPPYRLYEASVLVLTMCLASAVTKQTASHLRCCGCSADAGSYRPKRSNASAQSCALSRRPSTSSTGSPPIQRGVRADEPKPTMRSARCCATSCLDHVESTTWSIKEAQKLEADTFEDGDTEQPIPPTRHRGLQRASVVCKTWCACMHRASLGFSRTFQRDVVWKADDRLVSSTHW